MVFQGTGKGNGRRQNWKSPKALSSILMLGWDFLPQLLLDLLKSCQLTADTFMFQLVKDIDGGSVHEAFCTGAAGGWGGQPGGSCL